MGAALVPTIFKPEKNLVVVFLRIKLLLSEMATLVNLSDYLRINLSFLWAILTGSMIVIVFWSYPQANCYSFQVLLW